MLEENLKPIPAPQLNTVEGFCIAVKSEASRHTDAATLLRKQFMASTIVLNLNAQIAIHFGLSGVTLLSSELFTDTLITVTPTQAILQIPVSSVLCGKDLTVAQAGFQALNKEAGNLEDTADYVNSLATVDSFSIFHKLMRTEPIHSSCEISLPDLENFLTYSTSYHKKGKVT